MAWTKRLLMERLNADENQAQKILDVLRNVTPPENYDSVSAWVRACYNPPALWERKMYAFNEILEAHGIEGGCELNGDACDFSYVNMGDTYITTILYDVENAKYRLMSWGDFIEGKEAGNL